MQSCVHFNPNTGLRITNKRINKFQSFYFFEVRFVPADQGGRQSRASDVEGEVGRADAGYAA